MESYFITTLGLIAALFTTSSFIPQVVKIVRTRDTNAISLWMYIIITTGILLWLIYGILINDIPVIAANFVTLILSSIILIYKLKNK